MNAYLRFFFLPLIVDQNPSQPCPKFEALIRNVNVYKEPAIYSLLEAVQLCAPSGQWKCHTGVGITCYRNSSLEFFCFVCRTVGMSAWIVAHHVQDRGSSLNQISQRMLMHASSINRSSANYLTAREICWWTLLDLGLGLMARSDIIWSLRHHSVLFLFR